MAKLAKSIFLGLRRKLKAETRLIQPPLSELNNTTAL